MFGKKFQNNAPMAAEGNVLSWRILLGCVMLGTNDEVKHQKLTHLQCILMDKFAMDKLLVGS